MLSSAVDLINAEVARLVLLAKEQERAAAMAQLDADKHRGFAMAFEEQVFELRAAVSKLEQDEDETIVNLWYRCPLHGDRTIEDRIVNGQIE